MANWNEYPYTDFHQLNLDWIISKVKEYVESVDILKINFENLKNYVDNFIDNLDIQAAVDTKLEEMSDNGELLQLIQQFLTTESLLTFDTKNSMKAGQNFSAGVPVLTIGTATFSDKLTTLYRVRALTSSDVIDDDNIVALTNFPSLIAQKIIQNDPTEPVEEKPYYLFIGDSYANRENSWVDRLVSLLGLTSDDYTALRISGSGFLKDNYNYGTFQQNMENAAITDKTKVTDIIVCGGANDRTYTQTEIDTAIGAFCTSAKTNYPNAQVYIGMIAWSVKPSEYESLSTMLVAYSLCNKYGAIYLSGVEHALHRGSACFEDDFHPNATGQAYLAKAIYQAYKSGAYVELLRFRDFTFTGTAADITSNPLSGHIDIYHSGGNDIIEIKQRVDIEGTLSRNTWYRLGSLYNTFIFGNNDAANDIAFHDMVCYARNTATNAFELVKVEMRFTKYDGYQYTNTAWDFRFISPSAATISELYIGACKIVLDSMTQR